MEEIADSERKVEDSNRKKRRSSQSSNFGGSDIAIKEEFDDDYDNLVSKSLTCHFE